MVAQEIHNWFSNLFPSYYWDFEIDDSPTEPSVSLSEIISACENFAIGTFLNDIPELCPSYERIPFPKLYELFPSISSIKLNPNVYLNLTKFKSDPSLKSAVCSEVLRLLLPEINKRNSLKRQGIKLVAVGEMVYILYFQRLQAVSNINEYNIWVKSGFGRDYFPSITELSDYCAKIPFDGSQTELYKIPRSANVTFEHDTGYSIEDIDKTMSVEISDDNIISVRLPKSEYFTEIIHSIKRIDLELYGYFIVDGSLLNMAKYIHKNKVSCNVLEWKDYYITEILEGEKAFELACQKDAYICENGEDRGDVVDFNGSLYSRYLHRGYIENGNGFLIKLDKIYSGDI